MANARLMGEPINLFEPFIATLNSGMVLLVVPLGFLALISDYPVIDGSSIFYIFRIGRRNWLYGQVLQMLMMVASYILAMFAASVAGAISYSFIGRNWSLVATNFTSEFPEQRKNFGVLLLPENLYNQMTLPVALVESTLLVAAYLFSVGMILLAFTVAKRKAAGMIVCGLLIVLGSIFCSSHTKMMWIFPMSHSIVWMHYTEFLREPVFPLLYSALYFAAVVLTALLLCIVLLKRFDYHVISLEAQA